MSAIISAQWPIIALGLLAVTFNMYSLQARKGKYVMGKTFWQYKTFFEVINWAALLAVVLYLSSQYSWWVLLSAFVFIGAGQAIAFILKGVTQIFYVLGMPVLIILVMLHFAR